MVNSYLLDRVPNGFSRYQNRIQVAFKIEPREFRLWLQAIE